MEVTKISQTQNSPSKAQQKERDVPDVMFDQVFHKTLNSKKKKEPAPELKESCENKAPEETSEKTEEKLVCKEPEETKESQPKQNCEAVQMVLQAEVLEEIIPEDQPEGAAVSGEENKNQEQVALVVPQISQNQAEQSAPAVQQNAGMEVLTDMAEKKIPEKQTEAVKDSQTVANASGEKSKEDIRLAQPETMEILKTHEQPETSGILETDVTEALKDQAEVLKSMAQKPVADKEESTRKISTKPADVDKVQEQVDNKEFWNPQEAALRNLTGNNRTQYVDTKDVKESMPVPEQLTKGISQGISKGLQMFSIRLKPEGMGEVMVHLASAGGRIAMSIGVTSTETQKMLSSEMSNLKEMLKPLNAEVKEIYQSEPDGFDMMTYQQNFYQQQRQQYYAKLQSARHVNMAGGEVEEDMVRNEAVQSAAYVNGNLNAYV